MTGEHVYLHNVNDTDLSFSWGDRWPAAQPTKRSTFVYLILIYTLWCGAILMDLFVLRSIFFAVLHVVKRH